MNVSPSDFAFLYDSCKRCWWLKVNHRLMLGSRMPPIFNHIDYAMKKGITVADLNAAGIPAQKIVDTRKGEWVKSKPFEYDGTEIVILGKRDLTFIMDDGSYGVIDYKTTHPTPETILKYSRQLHAYEYAMTYPESGEAKEVGYLGLYCFDPFKGTFKTNGNDSALIGRSVSMPVPIDRQTFQEFMKQLCYLASSKIPQPDSNCEACETIETILSLTEGSAQALDKSDGMQPSLLSTPEVA